MNAILPEHPAIEFTGSHQNSASYRHRHERYASGVPENTAGLENRPAAVIPEVPVRISLGDVSLWSDVSGPSVIRRGTLRRSVRSCWPSTVARAWTICR